MLLPSALLQAVGGEVEQILALDFIDVGFWQKALNESKIGR